MIKNVQFEDLYLLLSAGVVSCRYLHVTWKYKTYRNPVYITMTKNVQFEDLYLLSNPGVVSCRYHNGTWKYKTYGNPVYINMTKKLSISRCTLGLIYCAGIVSY